MKTTLLFLAIFAIFAVGFAHEAQGNTVNTVDYTVDQSSLEQVQFDTTTVQAQTVIESMNEAQNYADSKTTTALREDENEFRAAYSDYNRSAKDDDREKMSNARERMKNAILKFHGRLENSTRYQLIKAKVKEHLEIRKDERENKTRDAWLSRSAGILRAWEMHIAKAKQVVSRLEEHGGNTASLMEIITAMETADADLKAAFEAKDKDKAVSTIKELNELWKQFYQEARSNVYLHALEATELGRINSTINALEQGNVDVSALREKYEAIKAKIVELRADCTAEEQEKCKDGIKEIISQIKELRQDILAKYKEKRETIRQNMMVMDKMHAAKTDMTQRMNETRQNLASQKEKEEYMRKMRENAMQRLKDVREKITGNVKTKIATRNDTANAKRESSSGMATGR